MKKTKKEINALIDKATSPTKKYELDEYEKIINKAFLPGEVIKQKKMTSEIDLKNKTTTIQKRSYISDLVDGGLKNPFQIVKLFLLRNISWAIIIPAITLIFTFIYIGVVPGEHGPGVINDPEFLGKISSKLYMYIFFIPTMLWMWWAVPSFILSIREDNYISRLKMRGYSEIQLILSIFVISTLTLLTFQLLIFMSWLPIVYQIGLAMNEELSNGFFLWDKVRYVSLLFHDISFLIVMSFIGIIFGFKLKNMKAVIIIVAIFLLLGLFIGGNEYWYFASETDQKIISILHGTGIFCVPFILSRSLLYDMVTINLLFEEKIEFINHLHTYIALLSAIIPIIIMLVIPRKIVSYKPVI